MTQGVLPQVPARALAFAYRPYVESVISSSYQQSFLDPPSTINSNSSGCIVERSSVVLGDRQMMAQMHKQAVLKRVWEAKRLVDDERFEYACDVVLECQRGFNFLGKANFSTKLLHPMDPPPWCDAQMQLTLANVHSFQVPDPSWQWVSPRWLIDMTQDVDEDGWQYASRFSANATWHGRHSAAKSFVRRRRWLRLRRRVHHQCGDDSEGEEEEVDSLCHNGEFARQPIIKAAASKIRSKVSGAYVGCSPKSPTSASARVLAYTLKDGKYRSHALKQSPPPAIPSGQSKPQDSSIVPGSLRDASSKSDKAPASCHKCPNHHRLHNESPGPLALPTGGMAVSRAVAGAELLASAAGSVADSAESNEWRGHSVEPTLPRLTALAPPEPTVPLGQTCAPTRAIGPPPKRNMYSDEDICGESTVVASRTDMQMPLPLKAQVTFDSRSQASSTAAADYVAGSDLLDAYVVDPYAKLQLASSNRQEAGAPLVDGALVDMAAGALKQMLKPCVLDRERVDALRAALGAGGITAAVVWYALPWLHFELLQFDSGRQQLMAALLSHAHTCPPDAPMRFLDKEKYPPLVLTPSEQKELDTLDTCLSPSQAWRLVVRPLIARDSDLFYSDYKLMVVGVARWSLGRS